MLVYRASLDKHKTLSFASLAAGQNRSIFSFVLVYRTPLDKQKNQNYARCRRESLTLEEFVKRISVFFRCLWRTKPYLFV